MIVDNVTKSTVTSTTTTSKNTLLQKLDTYYVCFFPPLLFLLLLLCIDFTVFRTRRSFSCVHFRVSICCRHAGVKWMLTADLWLSGKKFISTRFRNEFSIYRHWVAIKSTGREPSFFSTFSVHFSKGNYVLNPNESECTVISSLVYGHQGQIELCKTKREKTSKWIEKERE